MTPRDPDPAAPPDHHHAPRDWWAEYESGAELPEGADVAEAG